VSAATAETFLEELPELGVEDGVDDGVESAVDVAQPGDGAHQGGGDVAGYADGPRRVHHEERSPAEQEAAWKQIIYQLVAEVSSPATTSDSRRRVCIQRQTNNVAP